MPTSLTPRQPARLVMSCHSRRGPHLSTTLYWPPLAQSDSGDYPVRNAAGPARPHPADPRDDLTRTKMARAFSTQTTAPIVSTPIAADPMTSQNRTALTTAEQSTVVHTSGLIASGRNRRCHSTRRTATYLARLGLDLSDRIDLTRRDLAKQTIATIRAVTSRTDPLDSSSQDRTGLLSTGDGTAWTMTHRLALGCFLTIHHDLTTCPNR